MAAADYKALVQSIYISYFGRPADTFGLANFTAQLDALKAPTDATGLTAAYAKTPALKTLVDSFGTSAESVALYGTDTVGFVSAIYTNVLNRAPDFDGLVFWVNAINNGGLSKGNAALSIMAGALNNTSAQGKTDAQVLQNKVAIASNFTTSVDTGSELAAYQGNAAAAAARDLLKSVTATTVAADFQSTVDATLSSIVAASIPVVTTALTTGVDTLVGGAGNDNFKAIVGTTGATLTTFDSIDGGAGSNSLSITDLGTAATVTSLPGSSVTYKNIQTLNVQSATTGGVNIDGTAIDGLTAVNVLASTGPDVVKAGGATAIKVVNSAGTVSVVGGSTVDVTTDAASLVGVTGAAGKTTSVTIKGSNGALIVDANSSTTWAGDTLVAAHTPPATATANTIATVSLDSAGASVIDSDALTALNVSNTAFGATVNAAAGTRALNVALNKVTGGTIADATATTLNVASVTNKSSGVTLSAAAATAVKVAAGVDLSIASLATNVATSVGISGAGKVTIVAATVGALTSVDASANTGGVVITPALGTGVTFTGGAGNDSISIGATTKAITMGAGNDTVTLTVGALGTNGSVDAGAGVDTLAGTAALLAPQLASATAAKLTGFETIKVTDALAAASSFDVSALAGAVNFTAGAGVATGATANVTGLGANANVAINGDAANNGTLSLAMKTDTAADVLNVSVNHDFAQTNAGNTIAMTTNLSAASVETLNIISTGTGSVAAADTPTVVNNTLVIADDALVNLNISGAQAASYATVATQTKLAMIDASANTAGVTINAGLTAATAAALTIKGSATAANMLTGSANVDTIIGGAKSDIITGGLGGDTLTGNGGNDTFVIASGDSTIAAGKADTITDFVANTYGFGTNGLVTSVGANGVAANKLTGDVIQVTKGAGVTNAGITVGVYTNAADATTFLQTQAASEGVAANQTVHAALNSTTGDLYIDVDGNGTADVYLHLTGVTTLTAAAFLIV